MILAVIFGMLMMGITGYAVEQAMKWKKFAEQRFAMQQENLCKLNDIFEELQAEAHLAVKTLEAAGWRRCVGPAGWKPPLGPAPDLRERYAYPEDCDKIAERLEADGFMAAAGFMRMRNKP